MLQRLLSLLCPLFTPHAILAQQSGTAKLDSVPETCPVTKPYQTSHFVPPPPYTAKVGSERFWFGTDRLWTNLPVNVRVLLFAVLVGSLAWADLEQEIQSRVHLSQTVGNSLIRYRVQPICPYDACTRCAKAEVVLKVAVNKGGTVKQVTVAHGSNSTLAEAALDALRQWRYDRYVLNGNPVEYETHVTIKSWKCGTKLLQRRSTTPSP